jgi:peroxiredoxin
MLAHPLQPLIDRPIVDLALSSTQGGELSFRQFVGRSPLVLFFYILNGTPG